ncbi:hypothetical protein, partial [Pseudoalteromonas sp. P1-9]|uniref:hypothetical protein n=1 Tax=Pseudoalteromonas sp. P1-9 TaxID=1710354 RepID=UPI001379293F
RYYETLLSGEILAPIETDWTYRNFVALEQALLGNEEAVHFFSEMLEPAPGLQLPQERDETHLGEQGEHRVLPFNPVSSELIGLARQLGYPIQAVLLTGHMKVMSLMSGEAHAVSSVTVNGRPEQEGAEQSLG